MLLILLYMYMTTIAGDSLAYTQFTPATITIMH